MFLSILQVFNGVGRFYGLSSSTLTKAHLVFTLFTVHCHAGTDLVLLVSVKEILSYRLIADILYNCGFNFHSKSLGKKHVLMCVLLAGVQIQSQGM